MIRTTLNLLKFVFIFYLFFLFLIKAYMYLNINVNENVYPNLNGYSYLKVNDRYLYPDLNMDEHLVIGKPENIGTGDYVVYIDNGNVELYKVKGHSGDIYYCEDKNSLVFNIRKKDIKGKVIYKNNSLSEIINFLNKPIIILFMVLYTIFINQFTYDRDKRNV